MTIACVVISFNSSETIIETLNSIYEQDYKDIELVISDDCSNDDTCDLVDKWLVQSKSRFVKCLFLKSKTNKGISNNLNIALSNVESDWVKTLAADDLLRKTSISRYVYYLKNYNSELFFYSKIHPFSTSTLEIPIGFKTYFNKAISISKLNKSIKDQYDYLFEYNYIFSPAIFFNLKVFKITGGFDTDIPLLDDYPFFINVTKASINMFYIDEFLVDYRLSESSVQKSKKYYFSYYIFFLKYIKQTSNYKKVIWLSEKKQFLLAKLLFHFYKNFK